jgi:hypothetical protein
MKVAGLVLVSGALLGCESAETKACLTSYAAAQERVNQVDAKSKASVEASLTGVEAALATCKQAQRHREVDQLISAKNQLVAQVGALERRAARKARKPPSPEELKRLEKEGDPNCPKGQAYRPEGAKEIRCTGPQLAEMSAGVAAKYFDELGFRVKRPVPSRVEAEHGAERTTLVYADPPGESAPRCIELVPAPDIPWLEALTRATGANPSKLKTTTGKVKLTQGELAYSVDEKNNIVKIGNCPG